MTQNGPFYLPPALHKFYEARREVCAMVVLRAFDESRWTAARRLYEFYGPVNFAHPLARDLGGRFPDCLDR